MTDIAISRAAKKMLIFVSNENTIWKTLFRNSPTQQLIAGTLDLGASTISSWKTGAPISPKLESKIFFQSCQSLQSEELTPDEKSKCRVALEEFKKGYEDSAELVYTTAARIGVDRATTQKILDDIFYRKSSLFPGMHYESADAADRVFRKYGGLYYLWVRREDRFWFRCPLNVRYVLDLSGDRVIRCKLNFPNQNDQDEHWEYDGFMIERDNNIFWIFEKRKGKRRDYITFITPAQRKLVRKVENENARTQTLMGTYLTTDQSPAQSVVTGPVLLQQEDDARDDEKLTRCMRGGAKVFENEDRKHIEDICKGLLLAAP